MDLKRITCSLYLVTGIFFCFLNNAFAQIQLNKNFSISDTAAANNIKDLGTGETTGNLVNAADLMTNRNVYFSNGVYLNDTLKVNSSYSDNLNNGSYLIIKSNFQLTRDTLYIKLNQLNAYPVAVNGSTSISRLHIKIGQICVFQFKSDTLFLHNPAQRTCPTGFTAVNDKYCMQNTERNGLFFTALSTCVNEGYRLCTWAEWYYACQKNLPSLTFMTNNWEWVNSFQNEPDRGKVVGNGRCDISDGLVITTLRAYRCCFSK